MGTTDVVGGVDGSTVGTQALRLAAAEAGDALAG